MAEYIEREAAVAVIEAKQKELCPVGRYGRGYVYGSDREKYDNWEEIIDVLENLPVVDVAPVVHGHWEPIISPYGEIEGWICGCGRETKEMSNYCPNCGAKMDL